MRTFPAYRAIRSRSNAPATASRSPASARKRTPSAIARAATTSPSAATAASTATFRCPRARRPSRRKLRCATAFSRSRCRYRATSSAAASRSWTERGRRGLLVRCLKPICLALLAAIPLAGCSREDAVPRNGITASDDARQYASPEKSRTSRAGTLPDFASLVERHGDAVVNVEVIGSAKLPTAGSPDAEALGEFLERFGVPPDSLSGDALLQRGAGSGFIVSDDGYILTNAHVIANADEVTVRLTDRREFVAKVIGSDARTDVAVLKIDAKKLPVVRIGNRADVAPGEWVIALGSPFGLENTATAGIVSGTSRAVSGELMVPFIQTDVAVNPGNSGGPLFNLDGEVVGINSMIFSQSGGYMGISFAVPIDIRSEEHTSELQSPCNLVCRLLLAK